MKLTHAQQRALEKVVDDYGLMDRVTTSAHLVNATAARSLEQMGLVTINGLIVRATPDGRALLAAQCMSQETREKT